MHPHFDRSRVAAEDFGDLVVFQLLDAAQEQHFALLQRLPRERTLQQPDFLLPPSALVGRRLRSHHFLPRYRTVQPRLSLALARGVEVSVARDLKHPGTELVFRLERVPIFEHAKKDFLHEVIAELAMAGQADEKVEKRLVMPFEQHPELFHFAVPDLRHHLIVRERIHASEPTV